jgi:hypothetical protein
MFVNTTSNTYPTYSTSSAARNYQSNSNIFKGDNTNPRLANAGSVSISDNAYRALSEASQSSKDATDPVSVAAKRLIENVNSDPKFADEMGQAYAYSIDLKPIPLVNGHLPTANDTDAWAQMTHGQAKFEAQASSIRDQRIHIYTDMKAHGASGADIFKKLMEFNKQLPHDYQKMTRIDQFTKYF